MKVKTNLKAGAVLTPQLPNQGIFTPVKTWERFGSIVVNHNETLVRDRPKGLKVKTNLKAGAVLTPQLPNHGIFTLIKTWDRFAMTPMNHNETLVRDRAKGMKVKTNLKAGSPRDMATGQAQGVRH